jgi:hypothetical protein
MLELGLNQVGSNTAVTRVIISSDLPKRFKGGNLGHNLVKILDLVNIKLNSMLGRDIEHDHE